MLGGVVDAWYPQQATRLLLEVHIEALQALCTLHSEAFSTTMDLPSESSSSTRGESLLRMAHHRKHPDQQHNAGE